MNRAEGPGRARPKKRRVPRVLWSLLALAACGSILGASVHGVFRVRHVTVVGADVPGIAQTAGVLGQNIFTVRSDEVVQRLQQLHQIEVLQVDTQFPDRVTVHTRLRVPVVAWRSGRALFLVDAGGTITQPTKATRLPIVLADRPPDAALVAAVRQAQVVLPAQPSGGVAAFQVQPRLGLTIVGQSGWTAKVGSGSAQTLVNRVVTLAAVLPRLGDRSKQVKLVDLRYRAPYVQFAGA